MSEKEYLEKNELISGYIDGQLTPRQITELKRLLAHDSQCQQELEAMERQQRLLQSLPVESAPAGLTQEIQSALERQFILGGSVRHSDTVGKWGLRLRKAAAAAAMILLPLLALSAVVYTILQPTEQAPNTSSEPVAAIEKGASASPELLFSAVLQFQTNQPIAANDFIEKKIHTLGLMNFTTPARQSDRTSYKIVCSRKYVEGLVGELADLWSHSEKASYALLDTSTKQPVCVDGIDAQQALAMIRLADISTAAKLAQNISEQNTQKALVKANPADVAEPRPEKPSKPILAWDKDMQQVPADGQDTICLVIEVLGQ
ncbi:MAG: hypothetical protein FJ263_04500 [Planctomycetes bacterium]|nr:hypothetical protein [Planctomycetota bacterium]